MIQIQKLNPPPRDKRKKWRELFIQMKPGDSFHFEDAKPETVLASFAFFCAKGRYAIRKEGNGYRFYLVK